MDSLTRVYLRTTDPRTKDLWKTDVVGSIAFHAFLYTGVLTLFLGPSIPIVPLFLLLVLIMMIGYPVRLWRAQSLYQQTGKDLSRTRAIMDAAFSRWYFLG
jgi:antibiotic biosynthesis monooxygenase (ABM) superfamily enzyme